MEIKSSKDYHQTEQREKEEAMHIHEDTKVDWLHERLKCSKWYCIWVMRKRSKVAG
jgi:hypothetical protein